MLTITAVLALVLAYLALVTGYLSLRTLGRLRRTSAVLSKGADTAEARQTLLETTVLHGQRIDAIAAEMHQVRADLATELSTGLQKLTTYRGQLDAELAGSLRNIALVRYDAFDDMAGRMSFSLALLDDNGDGVTLSAIAGRSDTRIYAKGVRAGAGEHHLSPEEEPAVVAAVRSRSARTSRRRPERRAS
jgi:hypothetical protein